MTRNLNNADRLVRTGLGVILLGFAFPVGVASIAGGVVLGLTAVMLGTAVVGFCPLYAVLGISTYPKPHRTRHGHAGASANS
jgi:hypothetical protein